ncbi:MAG: DmsE family decaheme c-type cytochrome [Candidatus Acidiferrales bacterium]
MAGGSSVKSSSRETIECGLTQALLTDIPDKPQFRLRKNIGLLAASALFCWAVFGMAQTVKADEAFTVAGIKSSLPGWSQPAKSEKTGQVVGDSAFSALSSFAQEVDGKTSKTSQPVGRFDDQTYAALRAFAQRAGTDQPTSIKDLPKLAAKKMKGEGAPAHFVGSKVCATCHAAQVAEFTKTLMGRLSITQPAKFACENCHGAGSAHVAAGGGRGVGGIQSFEKDDPRSVDERNGVCLACHERGQRTLWQGSVHESRGLACTNCHTIMKVVSRKNQLKTAFEADTCFQCHKDRRAQMFRSSHMPLREGKITCSDCHNPHGSVTEALLKKDSINDVCYTCHAEKRGPFLFEHEPVRENCDNCHEPHGTVQQYSLKVARPRLCNECHNLMDNNAGPTGSHGIGQSCENCHTAIHGSNSTDGQLLFR